MAYNRFSRIEKMPRTALAIFCAPAAKRLAPAGQTFTIVSPFTFRKSPIFLVTRGDAVKSAVAAIAASGSFTFVLRRMEAAIRAMALSKEMERKRVVGRYFGIHAHAKSFSLGVERN